MVVGVNENPGFNVFRRHDPWPGASLPDKRDSYVVFSLGRTCSICGRNYLRVHKADVAGREVPFGWVWLFVWGKYLIPERINNFLY